MKLTVRDVMTRRFEDIKMSDRIVSAAKRMQELDVGALPVVDENNILQGLVTDRDIVTRGVAEGCNPEKTNVEAIMTRGAVVCPQDTSLERAAGIMERNRIRRLVVIEDAKAVGILSLGDLAVKTPGEELAGEVIEEVSEPAQPDR